MVAPRRTVRIHVSTAIAAAVFVSAAVWVGAWQATSAEHSCTLISAEEQWEWPYGDGSFRFDRGAKRSAQVRTDCGTFVVAHDGLRPGIRYRDERRNTLFSKESGEQVTFTTIGWDVAWLGLQPNIVHIEPSDLNLSDPGALFGN